ncbi:hypothetical protein ACOMHN_047457 [Nucella lapillus]
MLGEVKVHRYMGAKKPPMPEEFCQRVVPSLAFLANQQISLNRAATEDLAFFKQSGRLKDNTHDRCIPQSGRLKDNTHDRCIPQSGRLRDNTHDRCIPQSGRLKDNTHDRCYPPERQTEGQHT